ncbi:MAG TPA: hypothetical protein VL172_16215, partial [Kofleriaceae bacterium]|nr:hypothetical protein [Kofleriaceae bacterium]
APARARGLLDRRVLGWLPRVAGAHALGRAGARVARELRGAAGAEALADLSAFLAIAAQLADVLAARAEAARQVLAGPDTALVLVCTPDARGVRGALALHRRVAGLGLRVAGVIVNRVHPCWPDEVSAAELAAVLAAGGLAGEAWLADNFAAHERRARAEARCAGALDRLGLPRAGIPALDIDVHDLGGLAHMAAALGSLAAPGPLHAAGGG